MLQSCHFCCCWKLEDGRSQDRPPRIRRLTAERFPFGIWWCFIWKICCCCYYFIYYLVFSFLVCIRLVDSRALYSDGVFFSSSYFSRDFMAVLKKLLYSCFLLFVNVTINYYDNLFLLALGYILLLRNCVVVVRKRRAYRCALIPPPGVLG